MPSFVEMDNNISISRTLYDDKYALAKRVPIKDIAKEDYVYQPTKLKAVDQNPPAGTLIATGSKVIVYFEDTDAMHIDIYEGAHVGYADMKASDVIDKVKSNDTVKKIVEATEKSEDLTPEEEVIMVNFFVEALGLEMDESNPAKNNKAAYDVIVASYGLMK